jgi:hypothetical protein
VWTLFLRIVKHLGKVKDKRIDDDLNSASDYAALIQNLPDGEY